MFYRYCLSFNIYQLIFNILGEAEVVHVIADVGTVMNLLVSSFDKHGFDAPHPIASHSRG